MHTHSAILNICTHGDSQAVLHVSRVKDIPGKLLEGWYPLTAANRQNNDRPALTEDGRSMLPSVHVLVKLLDGQPKP